MDGILNIYKPKGMTSFDVIAHLRKVLNEKKIGHAGTLDPDACGVLPVCVGKATKALEFMIDKDKKYIAEVTFGISTDTQDASGQIKEIKSTELNFNEINNVMMSIIGEIYQVPPMYSALKIKGKKLVDLARQGIEVERQPRKVTIFDAKVEKCWQDIIQNEKIPNAVQVTKAVIFVHCSKGTYIRTLCEDMGQKIGIPSHMSALERVCAGIFDKKDSIHLNDVERLANSGKIQDILLPADIIFANFSKVYLNKHSYKIYRNGGIVQIDENNYNFKRSDIYVSVYCEDKFIGVGTIKHENNRVLLKSYKLFETTLK